MSVIPVLRRLGWCALGVTATVTGYLAIAVPLAAAVSDPILVSLTADSVIVLVVLGVRLGRPRWVAYWPEPGPMPHAPRLSAWAVLSWAVPSLAVAFIAGQSTALTLYRLLGSPGFDVVVEHQRSSPAGLVVLLTLVVAPMSEEALFRGLLYPLLRRRAGTLMSVIVTALAFAFMHGNLVQAASAVPLALLLALVYERTRALRPVVALHAVFNLAACVVPPTALQALATPLCSGLLLVVCALCLVYTDRLARLARLAWPGATAPPMSEEILTDTRPTSHDHAHTDRANLTKAKDDTR